MSDLQLRDSSEGRKRMTTCCTFFSAPPPGAHTHIVDSRSGTAHAPLWQVRPIGRPQEVGRLGTPDGGAWLSDTRLLAALCRAVASAHRYNNLVAVALVPGPSFYPTCTILAPSMTGYLIMSSILQSGHTCTYDPSCCCCSAPLPSLHPTCTTRAPSRSTCRLSICTQRMSYVYGHIPHHVTLHA